MRKYIEKIGNRIAAIIGVGALVIVMFYADSWAIVLASWLVMWVMLQLLGQSIATALEKRLPPPPYHLLVKPADAEMLANDLEALDVGGARYGSRTSLSRERKGDPVTLGTGKRGDAG